MSDRITGPRSTEVPIRTVKVDMHVHSEASNRPPQWFFRKLQTGECYTQPRRVYDIAKARGMDLVTVTDHDSIYGVAEIAHLSDVFVSEEISGVFPENRAVIHILAYDLTEPQHLEIQRLRQNVYELTRYLRQQDIPHVVAHPLSPPDGRLTSGQVEKMLLLFRNFELINGTRDPAHVKLWTEVTENLTRPKLAEMAERHGIEPVSWDLKWGFTAGSDDHGMIAIARAHTEFEGPATKQGLFSALREGRTRAAGNNGTPIALAHNIYSVSLGYVRHRQQESGRGAGGEGNVFRSILDSIQQRDGTPDSPPPAAAPAVATEKALPRAETMASAGAASAGHNGAAHGSGPPIVVAAHGHANDHSHGNGANGHVHPNGHVNGHAHGNGTNGHLNALQDVTRVVPWMKSLSALEAVAEPSAFVPREKVSERIGRALVEDFKRAPWFSLATLLLRGHTEGFEEEIYRTANESLSGIARSCVSELIDATGRFDIDRMSLALPELLSLGFTLLPYYLSFRWYGHDLQNAVRLATPILGARPGIDQQGVAIFTDVFDLADGVSISLRGTVETARAQGRPVSLLTCASGVAKQEYERRFAPIGTFPIPDYESIVIGIPPILEILKFCTDNRIAVLHAATPGPMGLTALLVGQILDLPVVGQYHTNLPAQAKRLANDHNIEKVVGAVIAWFYRACERTIVHSSAAADDLVRWGVPREKLTLAAQGIDVQRFARAPRDSGVYRALGVPDEAFKVLYVGRLAREKSVDVLIHAWTQRPESLRTARLVLVGDGPAREELAEATGGDPTVVFAGERWSDELARLYAAADLFVLPSAADTFGLVVVEAQAAGVPVIVTDVGGPQELIVPGETGVIVPAGDVAALSRALSELAADPARRQQMGRKARTHVADFSFERAVDELFRSYPGFAANAGPVAAPVPGAPTLPQPPAHTR